VLFPVLAALLTGQPGRLQPSRRPQKLVAQPAVGDDLLFQTGKDPLAFRRHGHSLATTLPNSRKQPWAPSSGVGDRVGMWAAMPPTMTRSEWTAAFIEEIQKLRPHLQPEFGRSKVAQALGMNTYDPKTDPKAAAQAYHAAQKAGK